MAPVGWEAPFWPTICLLLPAPFSTTSLGSRLQSDVLPVSPDPQPRRPLYAEGMTVDSLPELFQRPPLTGGSPHAFVGRPGFPALALTHLSAFAPTASPEHVSDATACFSQVPPQPDSRLLPVRLVLDFPFVAHACEVPRPVPLS